MHVLIELSGEFSRQFSKDQLVLNMSWTQSHTSLSKRKEFFLEVEIRVHSQFSSLRDKAIAQQAFQDHSCGYNCLSAAAVLVPAIFSAVQQTQSNDKSHQPNSK